MSCVLRSRPASKMYPICSCVRVLGCAYATFDRGFLKKTTCYTVMVLYCARVHQLDVYCHSTVLLLFWILSYFRVKENVVVWLLLFGRFRVKVKVSELVFCGSSRFWVGRGVFMTGGDLQVCQRSCWGEIVTSSLGGCCWRILYRCGSVLECSGVLLCFVVVIFALCCGWGRRSVCGLLGVWRSLRSG